MAETLESARGLVRAQIERIVAEAQKAGDAVWAGYHAGMLYYEYLNRTGIAGGHFV